MTTRTLCFVIATAGLLDASTGLGLIALPAFTLHAMGAPVPASSEAIVFVRFVGAFVFGVGLTYLWALGDATGNRIGIVLGATAIIRASVGIFVATSIATTALAWPWLTVAVVDLTLAGLQWRWIRKLT